jgi:hypothetical protein
MKFPRAQFAAIQRHKEEDRAAIASAPSLPTVIPALIKVLSLQERKLNNLYWSLFERGRCSDEMLAHHFMHERNAIRVRIQRLQRKSK